MRTTHFGHPRAVPWLPSTSHYKSCLVLRISCHQVDSESQLKAQDSKSPSQALELLDLLELATLVAIEKVKATEPDIPPGLTFLFSHKSSEMREFGQEARSAGELVHWSPVGAVTRCETTTARFEQCEGSLASCGHCPVCFEHWKAPHHLCDTSAPRNDCSEALLFRCWSMLGSYTILMNGDWAVAIAACSWYALRLVFQG